MAIKKRFDHVRSSLIFCNKALTEIYSLQREYDSDEEKILVQSPPFNFYNAALTYLVIMEYCKILENSPNGSGLSSVQKLWSITKSKYQDELSIDDVKEIEDLISFFKKSHHSDLIKKYRDKKFGHSDDVELNIPLHIPYITIKLAEETWKNLSLIDKILLKVSILEKINYEGTYQDYKQETKTQNFIRITALAREFYFKNYLEAKLSKI